MRALVIVLPLSLLLAVLWAAVKDGGNAVVEQAPVETVGHRSAATHVWVSHDWIEELPEANSNQQTTRRSTFGMDGIQSRDGQCSDSNCRACLIDFVYGREF